MIEFTTPDPCLIDRITDQFGALSNLSRHPVDWYDGRTQMIVSWPRAEQLFQALRFPVDHPVREMLRVETNPIRAKMTVKPRVDQMVVKPRSEQDLENMRAVLRAKVVQHPTVLECLRSTGRRVIVEDCSRRASGSGLYWGAMRVRGREHAWRGDNVLGGLWMLLRAELPGVGGPE